MHSFGQHVERLKTRTEDATSTPAQAQRLFNKVCYQFRASQRPQDSETERAVSPSSTLATIGDTQPPSPCSAIDIELERLVSRRPPTPLLPYEIDVPARRPDTPFPHHHNTLYAPQVYVAQLSPAIEESEREVDSSANPSPGEYQSSSDEDVYDQLMHPSELPQCHVVLERTTNTPLAAPLVVPQRRGRVSPEAKRGDDSQNASPDQVQPPPAKKRRTPCKMSTGGKAPRKMAAITAAAAIAKKAAAAAAPSTEHTARAMPPPEVTEPPPPSYSTVLDGPSTRWPNSRLKIQRTSPPRSPPLSAQEAKKRLEEGKNLLARFWAAKLTPLHMLAVAAAISRPPEPVYPESSPTDCFRDVKNVDGPDLASSLWISQRFHCLAVLERNLADVFATGRFLSFLDRQAALADDQTIERYAFRSPTADELTAKLRRYELFVPYPDEHGNPLLWPMEQLLLRQCRRFWAEQQYRTDVANAIGDIDHALAFQPSDADGSPLRARLAGTLGPFRSTPILRGGGVGA